MVTNTPLHVYASLWNGLITKLGLQIYYACFIFKWIFLKMICGLFLDGGQGVIIDRFAQSKFAVNLPVNYWNTSRPIYELNCLNCVHMRWRLVNIIPRMSSNFRHKNFCPTPSFLFYIRHACATPPGFWNKVNWIALVNE